MNGASINTRCEICFHFDEFSVCQKCFQKYLEKTVQFRKLVSSQRFILKSAIQEILAKNSQQIAAYNNMSQKKIRAEKMQQKVIEIEGYVKIKQNMVIEMSEKIRRKKENIRQLKETVEKEKINLMNNRNFLSTGEEIVEKVDLSVVEVKVFYFNFLVRLFLRPVCNTLRVEDYLEMHEYVKPHIKGSGNVNNNINDLKEFDKITNVLSISQSGGNFNFQNKELDIHSDKFLKFKTEILKNKFSIYNLNRYIYSISCFIIHIAQFLDVYLPYELTFTSPFIIKHTHNETFLNLYLESDLINHNDNYLNEILQAYIYLDYNLKFILKTLREDIFYHFIKTQNTVKYKKKYKNCYLFTNQHTLFTPDLNEFLNIKKLLPGENIESSINENNVFRIEEVKAKSKPEKEVTMEEVYVNDSTKAKEEDGFVIIENFYI